MPKRFYSETTAVLDQPLPENAAAAAGGAAGITYFLATQRDVVGSRAVAQRVITNLDLERDPDKARRLIGGDNIFLAALSTVRGWIARLFASGEDAPQSLHEWLIENLVKNLSVSSGRDSKLLRVGFTSSDPQFSAAAANAMMRAFLEVNVHLKSAPARSETAWLDGQLKELREDLAKAETKLSEFQQSKGIIATDERLDSENLRLADLSAQLAMAQADAFSSDARRRQLADFASGRGRIADAPAEVITSSVVMRLREDIAQREAKLADMSRELGPNHPRYKTAAGELDNLRGQLGSEMRSMAQGLATQGSISGSREAGLRAALEKQKGRLLGMKRDREQVSMLARDVDNAQRSYNSAVQRISQARIEAASERPNAALVDEAAVPIRPASPRTMLNLAIGCALGLLLGLGAALQLESAQRQVRSGEDLAEILGVPILAVLPPRALRGPAMRTLAADNVVALPKS
jgi:chain length determinant protein EpsF